MVTFVCYYCDVTLKKKQADGHIRGRCSPGALICIDCSQTFHNGDHRTHISCISEQEKHWGEFAKTKKTKPIAKQPKKQQVLTSKLYNDPALTLVNEVPKEQDQQMAEESAANEWMGWKKEIKILLVENGEIERNMLLKKLRKVYKIKTGEQVDIEELNQIFDDKIKKINSVVQKTMYSLTD